MDSSWFFMMNYWRKHHNLFSLKSWIIERSTNYTRFNLQSYEQRSKWTKKRFNLQSYEQRSKWTKKWTMRVSGLKKEFIIVCTNASVLRYFIEVSSLLSSFLFALYLYNFCCWWDISDLVAKRAALTRWNNSGAPTHVPPHLPHPPRGSSIGSEIRLRVFPVPNLMVMAECSITYFRSFLLPWYQYPY